MKKILLLSLLFFGTTSLYSAKLSPNSKIEAFTDFSYGLNTEDVLFKMDKKYSPSMSNVQIDEEDGRIMKDFGYIVLGSTATLSNISLFKIFKKDLGDIEYIVGDSESVLSTKDFLTYTLIKNGLNKNYEIQSVQVRDKMWFTNGADSVFTYDGTTVTVLDGQTYSSLPTPNVPKGKMIAFFQERVWIYGINSNGSSLNFTDLVSTNAVLIAPDNYLAWNSENQLNIGQGDGQLGTAIFSYKGNLYCAKERSIYRINGTDKYSYFASKTDSDVGISNQNAFTMLDNFVYFKAKNNGVYAFDGSNSERITDKINSNILSLITSEINYSYLTYDTFEDFNAGTFRNSTATASGTVGLRSTNKIDFVPFQTGAAGNVPYSDNVYHRYSAYPSALGSVSGYSTVFSTTQSGVSIPENTDWLISNATYWTILQRPSYGDGEPHSISFKNEETGESTSYFVGNSIGDFVIATWYSPSSFVKPFSIDMSTFSNNISFRSESLNLSSMTVSYTIRASGASGGMFLLNVATSTEFGDTSNLGISLIPDYTKYSYVSSVSSKPITANWGFFNSVYNTNGGNINFSYRVATSAVNITTYPFIPINSGSLINSTASNNFIQWKSSFSGTSLQVTPNIDNVNISYYEQGSGLFNPFMENYQNRVILSGSTGTSSTVIYQKVKKTNQNPIAWTKKDGINISSLLNTSDNFFAGASTYGAVYKMNFGTNYNGSAINSFYETKDTDFETPFFKKRIQKYYLDVERETGAIIRIGTSVDNGEFDYKEIDISGSGRHIFAINDVVAFGKTFKWRFENNQLDKDMRINGFYVIYEPTEIE